MTSVLIFLLLLKFLKPVEEKLEVIISTETENEALVFISNSDTFNRIDYYLNKQGNWILDDQINMEIRNRSGFNYFIFQIKTIGKHKYNIRSKLIFDMDSCYFNHPESIKNKLYEKKGVTYFVLKKNDCLAVFMFRHPSKSRDHINRVVKIVSEVINEWNTTTCDFLSGNVKVGVYKNDFRIGKWVEFYENNPQIVSYYSDSRILDSQFMYMRDKKYCDSTILLTKYYYNDDTKIARLEIYNDLGVIKNCLQFNLKRAKPLELYYGPSESLYKYLIETK